MNETFNDTMAGLILIADIQNFSLMPEVEQKSSVGDLHFFVEHHGLISTCSEVVLNGTGDGLLVGFPCLEKPVGCDQILELAKDILAFSESHDPVFKVRIGLHIGPFSRIKTLGTVQAVGRGPNMCARVTGIGDGGQIVASDDFVMHWHGVTRKVLPQFLPDDEEHPFEVFVKHDLSLRVRLYRRPGLILRPSKYLATLDVVDTKLRTLLKSIEQQLVVGLVESCTGFMEPDISARVSIFGPRRTDKGRFLFVSDYRYHRNGELTSRGQTRYQITGKGMGPPARAFCSRKVFVLHDLPDPDVDLEKYMKEVAARSGARQRDIKETWRRKARAFMAFPFGLADSDADGVVCIDTKAPLSELSKEAISDVVEEIRNSIQGELAALWAIRVHR